MIAGSVSTAAMPSATSKPSGARSERVRREGRDRGDVGRGDRSGPLMTGAVRSSPTTSSTTPRTTGSRDILTSRSTIGTMPATSSRLRRWSGLRVVHPEQHDAHLQQPQQLGQLGAQRGGRAWGRSPRPAVANKRDARRPGPAPTPGLNGDSGLAGSAAFLKNCPGELVVRLGHVEPGEQHALEPRREGRLPGEHLRRRPRRAAPASGRRTPGSGVPSTRSSSRRCRARRRPRRRWRASWSCRSPCRGRAASPSRRWRRGSAQPWASGRQVPAQSSA